MTKEEQVTIENVFRSLKRDNVKLSHTEIQSIFQSVDLNAIDEDGNSISNLLIMKKESLSWELLEFIIKNTDLNHKNKYGESFLHFFMKNIKLTRSNLDYILENGDLSARDQNGLSVSEYILGEKSISSKEIFLTDDELNKLFKSCNFVNFFENYHIGQLPKPIIDKLLIHGKNTITDQEKERLVTGLISSFINHKPDNDPNLKEEDWITLCGLGLSNKNSNEISKIREEYTKVIDKYELNIKNRNLKMLFDIVLDIKEEKENKNLEGNNYQNLIKYLKAYEYISEPKVDYILNNANLSFTDDDKNSIANLLLMRKEKLSEEISFSILKDKNLNINEVNNNNESLLYMFLDNANLRKENFQYILENGDLSIRNNNGVSVAEVLLSSRAIVKKDITLNEEELEKVAKNVNLSVFFNEFYFGRLPPNIIRKLIDSSKESLTISDKKNLAKGIIESFINNKKEEDPNLTQKEWIDLCQLACEGGELGDLKVRYEQKINERGFSPKNKELMETFRFIFNLNISPINRYTYLFSEVFNDNSRTLNEYEVNYILEKLDLNTTRQTIDLDSGKSPSIAQYLMENKTITKEQIQFVINNANLTYKKKNGISVAETIFFREGIKKGYLQLEKQDYEKLFKSIELSSLIKNSSVSMADSEIFNQLIEQSKDKIKGNLELFKVLNDKFKANDSKEFLSFMSKKSWRLLYEYGFNGLSEVEKEESLNMLLYGTKDNSGTLFKDFPGELLTLDIVIKISKDNKDNSLNFFKFLKYSDVTQKDIDKILKEVDLSIKDTVFERSIGNSIGSSLLINQIKILNKDQIEHIFKNTKLNERNELGRTFLSYYLEHVGLIKENLNYIIENGDLSVEYKDEQKPSKKIKNKKGSYKSNSLEMYNNLLDYINENVEKKVSQEKDENAVIKSIRENLYSKSQDSLEEKEQSYKSKIYKKEYISSKSSEENPEDINGGLESYSLADRITEGLLLSEEFVKLEDKVFKKLMKYFNFFNFFKNKSFGDFNQKFTNKIIDHYIGEIIPESKLTLLRVLTVKMHLSDSNYELSNRNWLKLYECAMSDNKETDKKLKHLTQFIATGNKDSILKALPEVLRLNIDIAIKLCEANIENIECVHPLLIKKLGLTKDNVKDKLYVYKDSLFLNTFLGKGKEKAIIQSELNSRFLRVESFAIDYEKEIESINTSKALAFSSLIEDVRLLVLDTSELNRLDFIGLKDEVKLKFKKDIIFTLPKILNEFSNNENTQNFEKIKDFISKNKTIIELAKTNIVDELSLKLRKETIIEVLEIDKKKNEMDELNRNKEESVDNSKVVIQINDIQKNIEKFSHVLSNDEKTLIKSIMDLTKKVQRNKFQGLHEYQANLLKFQLEDSLINGLNYYSLFSDTTKELKAGRLELSGKENFNLLLEKLNSNLLTATNVITIDRVEDIQQEENKNNLKFDKNFKGTHTMENIVFNMTKMRNENYIKYNNNKNKFK